MIGRIAIILIAGLLAFLASLLLADSLPAARPAASFDAAFGRLAAAVWGITAVGIVLGTVLASRWRGDRIPARTRQDGSIMAGLAILLLWTLLAVMA